MDQEFEEKLIELYIGGKCPHCGNGDSFDVVRMESPARFAVRCGLCGAQGPVHIPSESDFDDEFKRPLDHTIRATVEQWMRRYPSEEGDEDDVLAAGEDFVHDRYGYCYFVLNEGEVPFIHTLHTNDEYRGQGHARRHLEDVINKIRKSGHSGPIEINSAPQEDGVDGIRLAKFYKSLGLSVVGEHKDA